MTNKVQEYPWVQVFLEVALRAIRRVHLEYEIWGAGRQWNTGPNQTALINMGPGVELADERAVCAAIVQEMMASQSVAGFWQSNDIKPEPRFFSILREQK